MMIAIVVWSSLPHRLTAEERVMIERYDAVRTALANDDLVAARGAAAYLVIAAQVNKPILRAATLLQKSHSLGTARSAFAAMSKTVVSLANGNDGYYRIGCSQTMGRCPAPCEPCETLNFGDWIQTSPVVQNPFMGRAHPDCGMLR